MAENDDDSSGSAAFRTILRPAAIALGSPYDGDQRTARHGGEDRPGHQSGTPPGVAERVAGRSGGDGHPVTRVARRRLRRRRLPGRPPLLSPARRADPRPAAPGPPAGRGATDGGVLPPPLGVRWLGRP